MIQNMGRPTSIAIYLGLAAGAALGFALAAASASWTGLAIAPEWLTYAALVLAGIAVVGVLVVLSRGPAVAAGQSSANRYLAALSATATGVPFVMALIAIAAYLVPAEGPFAVIHHTTIPIAIALGLLVWVLLSPLIAPLMAVGADLRSAAELRERLDELQARLDVFDGDTAKTSTAAYREAKKHVDTARSELERLSQGGAQGEPRVVPASVYVGLWTRAHRAEEALMHIQPVAAVIGIGLNDQLRIFDSNMANSELLLARSQQAVAKLQSLSGGAGGAGGAGAGGAGAGGASGAGSGAGGPGAGGAGTGGTGAAGTGAAGAGASAPGAAGAGAAGAGASAPSAAGAGTSTPGAAGTGTSGTGAAGAGAAGTGIAGAVPVEPGGAGTVTAGTDAVGWGTTVAGAPAVAPPPASPTDSPGAGAAGGGTAGDSGGAGTGPG
jgi:hypothetical protein